MGLDEVIGLDKAWVLKFYRELKKALGIIQARDPNSKPANHTTIPIKQPTSNSMSRNTKRTRTKRAKSELEIN